MQFEYFQAVWFFWLLPGLGLIFVLRDKARRDALYRFIAREELKKRLPEYFALSSVLKLVCFLAALFFLGIALMMPYDGFEKFEIKRKGVDLYFLVDVSPSMNAEDVKPSRLDRARYEIKDFLKALTGDRVGLIGFSGEAFVLVPLTGDYDAFDLFLDELSTDLIPVPGTNIKGAMEKAVQAFKTQELASSKAIILISDGEDSVGLDSSMIADIRKHDIKVFIIGIGTPEGAPIPLSEGGYKHRDGQVVLSRLNESALQDLARATGGGYVRSVSGDLDLNQIYFGGIKKSFKDAEYGTAEKKLPRYRFQWALILGFVFLVLEALIPKKKPFAKTGLARMMIFGIILTSLLSLPQQVRAKNPIVFGLAGQAFEKGEYEKALESYLKLKEKNPGDPEIDYNLGATYYRLENYDAAKEAFERALNVPDERRREETLYNLGNTAYRQNKLDEALSYYEKALQMDPHYDKAKLNYEFVKKKKEKQEEQKKQEQKKEDQKQDEEKKQEEKQRQEQQEKDESQKQEEPNQDQKNQQEKNDQSQEQEDQKQKEQGEKDEKSDQQKDEQKDGGEQKQDQEQKEKSAEQQENEMAQQQSSDTGSADKNPHQWLQSLSDNPGKALKYLIEKKSLENPKRFDKDW